MAVTEFHYKAGVGDIHIVHDKVYPNQIARKAVTVLDEEDRNKLVVQLSDESFWRIATTNPVLMKPFTAPPPDVADIGKVLGVLDDGDSYVKYGWVPGGTSLTYDDVYNNESGTHNIDVNDGDILWNLNGAYSHITDLSSCSGIIDGFFINDGADYFKLTHKAADSMDLDTSLRYADITALYDIDFNVGTRSARFEDQPFVPANGGPGTPGGFKLSTLSDNFYLDIAGIVFIDADDNIHINASGNSDFNIASGDLSIGTVTSGDLLFYSAGNFGFNQTVFGTAADGVIAIGSGTAPITSPPNAAQLWVADRGATAGKAGLHLRSEDGTGHVFSDYVGIGTIAPAYSLDIIGTLRNSGGRLVNITTVDAATYDLIVTDNIVHVIYTTTGAVTSLTLPTAQVVDGRIIRIKDAGLNAGTNNITIDTGGSETIDGAATYVISTNGGSVDLYAKSGNWFVV